MCLCFISYYKYILQILDDIYGRFGHLLTSFDLFDKQLFAAAIQACVAPLATCAVFSLCNSRGVPYPLIVIMHLPISLDFNQCTPFILLTDDLINCTKKWKRVSEEVDEWVVISQTT